MYKGNDMRSFSVLMPVKLINKLDAYAAKGKCSRASAIRYIIEVALLGGKQK